MLALASSVVVVVVVGGGGGGGGLRVVVAYRCRRAGAMSERASERASERVSALIVFGRRRASVDASLPGRLRR